MGSCGNEFHIFLQLMSRVFGRRELLSKTWVRLFKATRAFAKLVRDKFLHVFFPLSSFFTVNRHRSVMPLAGKCPILAPRTFVAPRFLHSFVLPSFSSFTSARLLLVTSPLVRTAPSGTTQLFQVPPPVFLQSNTALDSSFSSTFQGKSALDQTQTFWKAVLLLLWKHLQ